MSARRPSAVARAARAAGLACLVAAGLAPSSRPAAADGPAWAELEVPARVEGLKCVDADGDGVRDVLVVGGREVRGWRGARDGLPAPAPTWTWRLPAAATFCWPGPPHVDGAVRTPMLLALAGSQVLRLAPGRPPAVEEGLVADVPWADARKAVLAEFVRGRGLVLPTPTGLRFVPDAVAARGTGADLPLPRAVTFDPPGPFVEDGAEVEASWPWPEVVAPGPAAPGGALVAFAADALHGVVLGDGGPTTFTRATAGLPTSGSLKDVLVDLTGDGVPDLVREATTNETGTYAFVPVPSLAAGDGPLVPRTVLRLEGFQIPSDYVDLDGDGRKDFVVTTIEIDRNNVIRAVAQGRVTARTRAFLNRSATDPSTLFASKPDAEVASDIRVRILFTFSGAIDVQRSYTILATADLDGDGRKDLVIRTPEGPLSVRRGTAAGVWDGEARSVAIPPVGDSPDVEGYVTEATGDRKDDLVLLYRAGAGGADRVYLVPSR